ncbi:hypothetical protein BAX95_00220 [Elizabethkingia meningoseptica]|uniref:hypothetical protein n=1 Tax=Elizabethkingia meningoseptica TaxID=238 RepID=UPI0009990678|nr:hypothetical protein [Elizabethkingia meningoseptica]OPC25372.1 hypothetical protein BAX95_00220 [Elizabethkingia meningoseptica]
MKKLFFIMSLLLGTLFYTQTVHLVDSNTGALVSYDKVTKYYDGTNMTMDKVDGYVYRKKGDSYYKLNIPELSSKFLIKNTIAEVRNMPQWEIVLLKMGKYEGVQVLGYYQKGDTPTPIVYYLSNTSTPDNGGSTIVVNNVRLVHDFAGSVDVRYFGAKGDGTIDNVPFVQKATDYLIDGGEILFGEGNYLFKGTYKKENIDYNAAYNARKYDGVLLRSNITYRGIKDKTILIQDASSVCIFTNSRTFKSYTDLESLPYGISFIDLTFKDLDPTFERLKENTAFIMIGAVKDFTITGCRFIGWKGDAVTLGENNNVDLSWQLPGRIVDVKIYNNFFDGVRKDNRQAITLVSAENVNIYNNSFYRTTRVDGSNPVYSMPGAIDYEPILPTARLDGLNIYDNYFEDIGGSTGVISIAQGLNVNVQGKNVNISRNTFVKCTNEREIYVVGMYSDVASSPSPSIIQNVSISDNKLISNVRTKIEIASLDNVSIKNNIFSGAYNSYAMIVGYSTKPGKYGSVFNMAFDNNNIDNIVKEGNENLGIVYLLGNIYSSKITNNIFKNSGNMSNGTPVNMVCVQFLPSSDLSKYVDISNNTFINTGVFSENSPVVFSVPLNEPLTFSLKNNNFKGFSDKVYTGADSIYKYVVNSDSFKGYITAPNSVTLNVSGGQMYILTSDITTSITGGKDGQIVYLTGKSSGSTVNNGNNIHLKGGANVTLNNTKFLQLVFNGGQWYEMGL